MIGTLGRKIIFEVSDNRVLTFESMSREVSGRWTEHEVLGVKPKAEFLGPGLQTISLTIHLSAALGVKPRRILDMVERMVRCPQCGGKRFGGVPGDRRQTGGPPSVPRYRIERSLGQGLQPRRIGQGYPDHFTGGIRMNENDLFNFQLEYTFTADWLAELDRQLALLLSTREGTMPLDRAFGLNMDFVDMPPEAAKSLYTAEVTEKVSKFIPEVRVQEVTWTGGNTGKLFPKVVITSA